MTANPATTPAITGPVARALAAVAAPSAQDSFVAKVLATANKYRAQNGAGPLVLNTTIGAGSQQWSLRLNTQINKGTLNMSKLHRTDAGVSILPAGYDMYSEVIGINGTPQQIVDWWMNSPAHRAALMDRRATDLGLGYVTTSKAGWNGMTVVVGNLAGYPASRAKQPQPDAAPLFAAGDIAAVDGAGNLFAYPSAKGDDLWNRNYIAAGWSGARQLNVVDYNNDGRMDLITVWSDGRLTASYGQANGTLTAAKSIGTGWGALDVVVTKWTSGSAYPSIIAKNRMNGQLLLYPNLNGTKFGTRQLIGTGWGSLTILAADFDGDKKQDLLARNSAGQLLLYRSNGTGRFISEKRRVVGTGWNSMAHMSGIAGHISTGSYGVLARSTAGNLYYYPILRNSWGTKLQIGTGGWQGMKLGS